MPGCARLLWDPTGAIEGMSVSFRGPSPGTDTFDESLSYFTSVLSIAAFDQNVARFFATCKQVTDTTQRPPLTYTFEPLKFPRLGDDAHAALATVSVASGSITSTYANVIAQTRHVRVALVLTRVGAPNVALLTRLARTVMRRAVTLG